MEWGCSVGQKTPEDEEVKKKYVGTMSLLVTVYTQYVQMAVAAGENPDPEIRAQMLQCAEGFNASSKSFEVRPCGPFRFGIFCKEPAYKET